MLDGRLTIWTIMDKPEDFPDKIVVVCDEVGKDNIPLQRRPERWFADSIEHARAIIKANDPTADFYHARHRLDPKCIVESWY